MLCFYLCSRRCLLPTEQQEIISFSKRIPWKRTELHIQKIIYLYAKWKKRLIAYNEIFTILHKEENRLCKIQRISIRKYVLKRTT